jgi:hypothetical protein
MIAGGDGGDREQSFSHESFVRLVLDRDGEKDAEELKEKLARCKYRSCTRSAAAVRPNISG